MRSKQTQRSAAPRPAVVMCRKTSYAAWPRRLQHKPDNTDLTQIERSLISLCPAPSLLTRYRNFDFTYHLQLRRNQLHTRSNNRRRPRFNYKSYINKRVKYINATPLKSCNNLSKIEARLRLSGN